VTCDFTFLNTKLTQYLEVQDIFKCLSPTVEMS